MPLIRCSSCHSTFDVSLDVLGKKVKCPKCKSSFLAQTKVSGPRRKQKSQAPYWIGGTLLFVLVLFLVVQATSDGSKPSAETAAANASGSSSAGAGAAEESEAEDHYSTDPVRRTVEMMLDAIQDEDQDALLALLSCPRIQDRRAAQGEGKAWSELNGLDQALARQQIVQELLGDANARRFLSEAGIDSFDQSSSGSDEVTVQTTVKSLVDSLTQQDRTIILQKSQGNWRVVAMTAGPIVDPIAERAKALSKREQDSRKRRTSRLYGEVQTLELLAETSPQDRQRLEELCSKLTDLTLTREMSKARRELVAMGKPAIPALLNLMVGREALESQEEQQILNQVIQTLREITLEDFGFAPGGYGGNLTGESLEANQQALRRWFGWWRNHKDTWTGPDENPPSEDLGNEEDS
jgi:predicted Zn finger-like uncharacterized protein